MWSHIAFLVYGFFMIYDHRFSRDYKYIHYFKQLKIFEIKCKIKLLLIKFDISTQSVNQLSFVSNLYNFASRKIILI